MTAAYLPRVLIIGDSISIGYFGPLNELIGDRYSLVKIPVNGESTHNGLIKLDSWLGGPDWDIIHFNWGLHDLKYVKNGAMDISGVRVSTLDVYKSNLVRLVEKLQSTRARLIWASTTPIPAGANARINGSEYEFNEAAAEIMRARGIEIDDLHTAVLPRLAELQLPADVHYNDNGSKFLAQVVAKAIEGNK